MGSGGVLARGGGDVCRHARSEGIGDADAARERGVAFAASEVVLLTEPLKRMLGLLFRNPDDRSYVLSPCRDIHTFGMRYAIDVAFVDGEGRVLATYYQVGCGRRLRCARARMVVERFSRDEPWWAVGAVGDYVQLHAGSPDVDRGCAGQQGGGGVPWSGEEDLSGEIETR